MKIYTITVVSFETAKERQFLEVKNIKSRTWGCAESEEEAFEMIDTCHEFMEECGYYTHVILESVEVGELPASPKKIGVYKWNGERYELDNNAESLLEHICSFAMG